MDKQSKITIRIDDETNEMIRSLVEKDKVIALKENRVPIKPSELCRTAIKEKYIRDVTGKATFSYMEMLKSELEMILESFFSAQREHINRSVAVINDKQEFNYRVLAKFIGMILCGEGFPNNEEAFSEVVKRDYVYREILEENILEHQMKNDTARR